MATRSILGSINNAASLSLINGTVDIIANSLSSNSLAPGTTVKTDTGGSLISADLTKSDIVDLGDVITNPLTSNLDCDGKSIINNPEIDDLTQKTQYITALEQFGETNFSGGILVNGLISNTSEVSFANGATITGVDAELVINGGGISNSIISISNISTTGDMTCGTIKADTIDVPAVTTLQTKTQYQSVFTPSQATIFTGIVNATTTLAVGTAQSGQTGYNLPLSRPLIPGYVMVTPASTGNTLSFQLAADPARTQNLTASTGQSTFSGILNVGSDLKVNGLSTLVGGILSNQKITLTKNIIEIQEDGVYTEAITIGNLATTGYSLPRTNGGISGQELRLQSNNKLGWYSPSTYIRFNRNTTLGSVTLLTSPINTRISIFPLLINESTSPFNVFNTTASGAQYISTEPRKAFQMSYNTMATIATNPSGGEYVFRLIHRKAGPIEAVISAFRLVMTKDVQYTISLQAVGFDILQNDVLDVSIEGSLASTIQLDSQQVSIIAH